ncbi:GH3 auxin-responsive promoter family protein [Rurimicrobium arvi]|uniref:GH3 auxin-responsive promoter family protein n=1 Tax=Rurimicrobium arvi TaxID=2049916 RepID=A0ABP8MKI5_9BACT
MKLKSFLAKPYAYAVQKKIRRNMANAVEDQSAILQQLLKNGKLTLFGKDHHMEDVKEYEEFRQAIPVRDYEGIRHYIDQIKSGTENVLWRGKPMYFAKTSGTTSGVKYIPISKDSISNHIDTAKYALLNYMAETGRPEFADGKMIFLSGSPTLERVGGIPTGRLSGIVNHFVPGYLRRNQMPSFETNCIEDWETKLHKIVTETSKQDMRLISGIPPWMQMYFDWLSEANEGKKIKELFPNLQVIVHGGVNFQPYRAKLMESLGGNVDTIETFPASEGFFAFQDSQKDEGLLLNTNSGIFFEFIPAAEIFSENPRRLTLKDVQLGENYALIVNSNAGLWGYNIGDTVKFLSLDPYRIVVTGRIKHFISAFGEHVIAEEVEYAMRIAAEKHGAHIIEFTVAPMIQTTDGSLPYHEWLVSFEQAPDDLTAFATTLDETLRQKNVYYDDLLRGAILQTLKVTPMHPHAFIEYMKSIGKLGGQNKVPRLSNDRVIADAMAPFKA